MALAGISFLSTMGSGILTSALRRTADDIGFSEAFLVRHASVWVLSDGCLLLVSETVADIVGVKLVWTIGSFLYATFTIVVGLSRTGIQFILFRTGLGGAISMCLPAAASLITNTFPKGIWPSTVSASNAMGQLLGYSVGLILGGVFHRQYLLEVKLLRQRLRQCLLCVRNLGLTMGIPTFPQKAWIRRSIEGVD